MTKDKEALKPDTTERAIAALIDEVQGVTCGLPATYRQQVDWLIETARALAQERNWYANQWDKSGMSGQRIGEAFYEATQKLEAAEQREAALREAAGEAQQIIKSNVRLWDNEPEIKEMFDRLAALGIGESK